VRTGFGVYLVSIIGEISRLNYELRKHADRETVRLKCNPLVAFDGVKGITLRALLQAEGLGQDVFLTKRPCCRIDSEKNHN